MAKKYNVDTIWKIKSFLLYFVLKTKYLLKYKTTDFFNYINIELNTSCNRRCSYCPNSIYDRGLIKNEKLMPEKTFKKIINELAEINYTGKILPQNFGEPLLDKRLFKFMKHAKEKLPKSKVYIITNGDYLTGEVHKKLVESGIDKIIVSPHDNIEYQQSSLNNRGGLVKPKNLCISPRCLLPDNPVIIDYAGNVLLCCNDYLGKVKFGNVNEKKLADIWDSKKYKRIRRELKQKNFNLPICRKCVGLE